MSELRKVRQGGAMYDILIPDNIPEYYVDGFFQTMVGVPVSKVLFFRTSAASTEQQMKEGIESRKAVFELAIPTTALVQFAQNVLISMKANSAEIDEGFEKYQVLFNTALNGVSSASVEEKKS